MSEYPCIECGCTGNRDCGADHVDPELGCTLSEDLCCPCCAILGKEANMARWPENNIKPDSEQEELL